MAVVFVSCGVAYPILIKNKNSSVLVCTQTRKTIQDEFIEKCDESRSKRIISKN